MKRKSHAEELNRTLESIGRYGLKDDWDRESGRQRQKVKRGESKWLEIHDDPNRYGRDFDFRVMDGDVFMPCCDAAQHWLWYVVGETQHWYGDLDGKYWGCVVDEEVLAGARRDGLIRESDYVEAMNENDNLMRQGE